jgi:hypothetical protein
MAIVELHTENFPAIYKRFAEVVGDRHWRQRVRLLEDEIRGNPLLADLHRRDNAIAYQLERLAGLTGKFGAAALPVYDDEELFPGATFAAQVLSILDSSPRDAGERLKRRVHGAFKNPPEMRALRLELAAATHFLRAGRGVTWPEMTSTSGGARAGTFDLLVEDSGPTGLEIECKSVSDQRGQRISRRSSLDFLGMLRKRHWDRLRKLRTGLVAVLTVDQDLPNEHKARQQLADFVARAVLHLGPGDYREAGAHLRIADCESGRVAGMQRQPLEKRRRLLEEVSGTVNKEVVAIQTPEGGALVLVIQSELDDDLLESIFAMLRDSAPRQFSGRRAAMFVVGLDGVSAEQLLEVALHDRDPGAEPTVLRQHTSRFLESESRAHVVGVSFLSASALRPVTAGVSDSGGAAYYFPNPTSRFWSEDYRELYGQEPRPRIAEQ